MDESSAPAGSRVVKFPLGTLLISLGVDIAEWFDFSGLAYAITVPLLLGAAAYLWKWLRDRGRRLGDRSFFKKQFWKMAGSDALELVPVLNWIPWTALFVLETYRQERRIDRDRASATNAAATRERRGSAGPGPLPGGVTRQRRGS